MRIVLNAGRLPGHVLTERAYKRGGRPTKLEGGSADFLKNHILKRLNLNLKQTLNQGDQGKELNPGKSMLQISTLGSHSIQFHSLQFQQSREKELRMRVWRL